MSPERTRAQKIRRRTLVGGTITLVLVLALWLTARLASPWPVFGLTLALSIGCALELRSMGRLASARLGAAVLPAIAASAFVIYVGLRHLSSGDTHAAWTSPLSREAPSLWAQSLAAVVVGLAVGWRGHYSWRTVAGASLWVAVPLLALTHVWREFGMPGLVALIVLSKVGDIAGYYVGSAMGKRHPFPNISPGKTVAGCVASLAFGGATGLALSAGGILPEGSLGLAGGLLAGLWVNVASQAGDLLESVVKRRAGVKDSGTLFGPSGGFLDLTDSLLLSVPAALLLWPALF